MIYGVPQKWQVFAFNATTGFPVTGDAANITAKLSKDGGPLVALDDANPVELEAGYYEFDITATEATAAKHFLLPVSSTANVVVLAVGPIQYAISERLHLLNVSVNGMVAVGAIGSDLVDGVEDIVDTTGLVDEDFLNAALADLAGPAFDPDLHSLVAIAESINLEGIKEACAAALVEIHLDHLFAVQAPISNPIVDGSFWALLTSKTGTYVSFDPATDSLEAIRDNQAGTDGSSGPSIHFEQKNLTKRGR